MPITRASQWTLRSAASPGPSKSIAYRLLRQGGFISKIDNGLFGLLPNGQRVVDRLLSLIENELNAIGAQKVTFPILAPKKLWDKTKRWDSMGPELMTMQDRQAESFCLQPTAEEMCVDTLNQLGIIRKDALPILIYQSTEKFRDEAHARYGVVRAKQFLMNDLYSFDLNSEQAVNTYEKVSNAYDKIFKKYLKLKVYKIRADSGVHGGKLSHEYHIKNPLNQDEIVYCHTCQDGGSAKVEAPCPLHGSEKMSTIEIAHTFQLGTKYSTAFGLQLDSHPLEMCCFGIGVTRLMHGMVELLSPPSGQALRLPPIVAPFDVALIVHGKLKDSQFLGSVLSELTKRYQQILLDDRNETLGNRIRSLSLTGIPRYVILGGNTVKTIEKNEPTMELYVGWGMAQPGLELRAASLNCWALPQPWPIGSADRRFRLEKLADALLKGEYDVIGLQELWSEYDYLDLAERVQAAYPFSHYFHSGFTGSGVAVISKYPIVSTLMHRYSLNGFAHHIHRGDWFGGKVVGMVELEIGELRVNFYATHLHAEYNRLNDLYLPHRLAQSFELSQFVRHTSRGADFVILCGDMNMEPDDLGLRLLMSNTKLHDAWRIFNEGHGQVDTPTSERTSLVRRTGMTCDRPDNYYTSPLMRRECPDGKRIDYMFYKSGRMHGHLEDSGICFNKIPNEELNYSDHVGVYSVFHIHTENRHPSMIWEHELPLLKEVINIVRDGQKRAHRDRSIFIGLFVFLVVILIGSLVLDYIIPFMSLPLSILRFVITLLIAFCVWYGFLGLTMELKALKGTRQAMAQLLNE
ncbi:unnamed protein product, partial [Mesorhabditis belari]|uniref:proline--tRNA ligase n=1 Tax=Mesorhabditis belari TaxID=2138241 RepID=A0AAF3FDJ6_9BILA